jgi:hypothetical protein
LLYLIELEVRFGVKLQSFFKFHVTISAQKNTLRSFLSKAFNAFASAA